MAEPSDWRKISQGCCISLVVHCSSGSKEAIKLLHRSGAGISCNDVTKQLKSVSAEVQNNVNLAPKYISKGQPTHITIDNSDGRQQTLTSLAKAHHTNATVYNPKNEEIAKITQKIIGDDIKESNTLTRRNINNYEDYKIGKPSPPPVIESYTDNTDSDQLDY